jgi:hypothetical protein
LHGLSHENPQEKPVWLGAERRICTTVYEYSQVIRAPAECAVEASSRLNVSLALLND